MSVPTTRICIPLVERTTPSSTAPTLPAEVLAVLRTAECEADRVRLTCGQLDRATYDAVNEVLERLGGKWKGGRTRAHLFAFYDPRPLVAAVVATGEMPPKNPTAFFPTPPDVVARALDAADLDSLEPGFRILEPSAGSGAFLDALRDRGLQADAVEALDLNVAVLRSKGYDVHEGDFLAFDPGVSYDRVVMNPPFAVEGDRLAYIAHIRHAFDLLADDGLLVAIAPTGFTYREDKKSRGFRELVTTHGGWEMLPDGTFKASGTGVRTVLVRIGKGSRACPAAPPPTERAAAVDQPAADVQEPPNPLTLLRKIREESRKADRVLRELEHMLAPAVAGDDVQPSLFDAIGGAA